MFKVKQGSGKVFACVGLFLLVLLGLPLGTAEAHTLTTYGTSAYVQFNASPPGASVGDAGVRNTGQSGSGREYDVWLTVNNYPGSCSSLPVVTYFIRGLDAAGSPLTQWYNDGSWGPNSSGCTSGQLGVHRQASVLTGTPHIEINVNSDTRSDGQPPTGTVYSRFATITPSGTPSSTTATLSSVKPRAAPMAQVNWTFSGTNPAYWEVQSKRPSASGGAYAAVTTTEPGTSRSYEHANSGFLPSPNPEQVTYRVRGRNSDGTVLGSFSNELALNVFNPINAYSKGTSTGVEIAWTSPGAGAVSTYRIEKSTDGGATWTVLQAQVPSWTLSYEDHFTKGAQRSYRVRPEDYSGAGAWSRTVSGTSGDTSSGTEPQPGMGQAQDTEGGAGSSDPETGESCGASVFCWIKSAMKWAFKPSDQGLSAWQTFKTTVNDRPPVNIAKQGFQFLSDVAYEMKRNQTLGGTVDGSGESDFGCFPLRREGSRLPQIGRVPQGEGGDCLSTWISVVAADSSWDERIKNLLGVIVTVGFMFWMWREIRSLIGDKGSAQPEPEQAE